MTLSELETESDTTEAQKPMRARRASQTMSGCLGGSARASVRKLYYVHMKNFPSQLPSK